MPLFHPATQAYRPIYTDHEAPLQEFCAWARVDAVPASPATVDARWVFQVVQHPNFCRSARQVTYFARQGETYVQVPPAAATPASLLRVNAFKNFKSRPGEGHPKGMFYEVNLCVRRADDKSSFQSPHHTSTVNGRRHLRDCSADLPSVPTKGVHWTCNPTTQNLHQQK